MLRIQEVCKENGVSMLSLAERLGVTRQALHASINGNPTIGMLQKIADALEVDLLELFERKDEVRLFAEYQGEKTEITHSDIIQLIEQKKTAK